MSGKKTKHPFPVFERKSSFTHEERLSRLPTFVKQIHFMDIHGRPCTICLEAIKARGRMEIGYYCDVIVDRYMHHVCKDRSRKIGYYEFRAETVANAVPLGYDPLTDPKLCEWMSWISRK